MVGLLVVKVVVPGLRHFWARFTPGRLYDVRMQLGLLDRPLREEALNPVHMLKRTLSARARGNSSR